MALSNENLPRIFLANVGVNASHIGKGLQSPLFEDGSFEFVTIPELDAFQNSNPAENDKLVRYRDLKCFNQSSQPLTDYLPPRTHNLITHYDPEFDSFSYGDECGRTPRAAALKKVQPGDWLFFLARLANYERKTGNFTGEAGFYLIGAIEVETILSEVRAEPPAEAIQTYGHNAHLRRALTLPDWYDGFYIFKGSANSRRFVQAQSFGRNEANKFLRDKNGHQWVWDENRSPLQTIGSYTRTCRCVLDPRRSPEEAQRTSQFLEQFLFSQ